MSQPRWAGLCLLLFFCFLLISCESAPKGPAKGSPEANYQAAKSAFRIGEMEKVHDYLEKLEGSGPFAARAAAWQVLLESGMMLGPLELADVYDKTATRGGPKKVEYLREKSAQLKEVRAHALHLLETYPRFEKAVAGKTSIALEFPFPEGSAAPVVDLERIPKGMAMDAAQKEQMLANVMKRGIIRGFSAGISGIDDSAGAEKVMHTGAGEVPAAKFWLGVGESMARTGEAFGPKQINESSRLKEFYQHALDIVKMLKDMNPDADVQKAAKKLQADSEKALKAKK